MSVISLNKDASLLKRLPAEEHDVMEQILEHLGGMGRYQIYLFFMMMPVFFLYAFVYAVQIFAAATPNHWCRVPELMHLDLELRRNLSIPGAAQGTEWDRCSMYNVNWTQVLVNMTPPPPDSPTVPCQHGWEFVYDQIPYVTVVSEREWVCDKSSYAPTAQAMWFVGCLIGNIIFGWMGDRFGRVPAFLGANLFGCVGGIATVYTKGFWDFSFCRLLVGMSNDTGFMMLYILVLEYVGPKHRSWVSNVSMAICFGLGGVVLPALAYYIRDWRNLILVTSVPMLIAAVAPWVVPESARWLASTGKVNRAVKVLRKFERVNKAKIPDDLIQRFINQSSKEVETDESMGALIRSAPLRNSVLCVMLVSALAGIVIDAVIRLCESIGPDFFVAYAVSSVSEIPALALLAVVLDRFGRRSTCVVTVTTAGVLCFVCATLSQGLPQLLVVVIVRFSISISWGALNQLGTEILPTGLRALGSAVLRMTTFVATIASPFIVYSGTIWHNLPLVILGVMGVAGGGAALLLPETRGKPLPQTIADGERLNREGRLCGKPEKDETEEYEVVFLDNKKALELR